MTDHQKLKQESRVVFCRQWVEDEKPPGWMVIEFEKWYTGDTVETCQVKKNKSNSTKCHKPCEFCLELRAKKLANST